MYILFRNFVLFIGIFCFYGCSNEEVEEVMIIVKADNYENSLAFSDRMVKAAQKITSNYPVEIAVVKDNETILSPEEVAKIVKADNYKNSLDFSRKIFHLTEKIVPTHPIEIEVPFKE